MPSHTKPEIEGTITVELPADSWVWLCELLTEVTGAEDLDEFCASDAKQLLSCLEAAKQGV